MPLEGQCSDMCSPREREHRIHNFLVHQMETDDPWLAPASFSGKRAKFKANPDLMVKEYARSAADKVIKADDVRPFRILKGTIDYLLGRILKEVGSDSRAQWPVIYSFVMDRLRAVRQDMTVQDLPPDESMSLLEAIIPFYLSARYTCEIIMKKAPRTQSYRFYDEKLHRNESDECFAKWKYISDNYNIGSEKIKSMYLLCHCDRVDSICQFLAWKETFSNKKLSDDMFSVLLSYRLNNYVVFFKLLNQFDESLRYALYPFVDEMRHKALHVISIAYNSPNVKLPEEVLRKWLYFNAQEELYDSLAEQFGNIDLTDKEFVKFSGIPKTTH
ncbi:SAC3/GANP family domain-containing protein [Ditylenchus destructor]|uniref:SAC3/GANP family domain-containing protein n=1 Tax=Ditylenchus destructor TaxID=166010 RepID=A0AAD4R9P4_9BILA|nr:SAC3/GANP family domain-containing protein [Ditylenchus destructor]